VSGIAEHTGDGTDGDAGNHLRPSEGPSGGRADNDAAGVYDITNTFRLPDKRATHSESAATA
jgi:hypothetical protein